MRKFRLVNYADWGIDRSVSRARRARLLGKLSFEAIVERLLSEVRIMRITHEKGDNTKRGLHRWVITLIANPHTIDLWHNSRGGYRAQYYVDPAIGDAANTYACRALVSVAQRLIEQDNYRKHFWSRAAKSVCHSQTRVWIGQGLWLRHARCVDQVLHVSRWQQPNHHNCGKASKLRKWGALAPSDERRIVLKGQWLDNDGSAISEPPKASRAKQINRYGFT